MIGPNGLILFSVWEIDYLVSAGELVLGIVVDNSEDPSFSDVICLSHTSFDYGSFLEGRVIDEIKEDSLCVG
jgi:hypothetical protein